MSEKLAISVRTQKVQLLGTMFVENCAKYDISHEDLCNLLATLESTFEETIPDFKKLMLEARALVLVAKTKALLEDPDLAKVTEQVRSARRARSGNPEAN